MLAEPSQQRASEQILQDLVDCLLAEGFMGENQHELLAPARLSELQHEHPELAGAQFGPLPERSLICRWTLSAAPVCRILLAVRPGIVQRIQRVRATPVYIVTQHTPGGPLQLGQADAIGLMELLGARSSDQIMRNHRDGVAIFLEWLREASRQTAWSLSCRLDTQRLLSRSPAELFSSLEQCASLRDRPFHPLAKAKKGFAEQDYREYMAEFGGDIPLRWMAVDLQRIDHGSGVNAAHETHPAHFLLSTHAQPLLREEMQWRGIGHSHIALPVHPWQMRQVLPKQLATELQSGTCVPLDFEGGAFRATSSVRSFAPPTGSAHHLKLPLGIYSLGASRYLPAVKMINGQRSEALLRRAISLDPVLKRRVFICDETKWWAYMPRNGALFDEPPRHLAAMVRTYPREVIQDPGCRMIPMAALGMLLPDRESHLFDEWLQYRRRPAERAAVLRLFREIAEVFFEINLRLFRIGMLAEVHGQNAVLIWHNGAVSGLLLRDHDSLRVHVPWLVHNGLADPQYRLKPGHPNTLYHDRPEDLLFYLQTLAIQVNARAIIESLSARYRIAETALWSVLRDVLEDLIDRVELPAHARALLRRCLFNAPEWPLKLLIRPMIERAGGPGSMPFGKGVTQNPFHHLV